jgi:arylsulfatase A-like enzyme
MVMDEGSRVPAIVKWPGHVAAGTGSNGIISGLDWFPTLTSIAGNPDVKSQLLKGLDLDGRTYRVHLDGYDQTDLLTGVAGRAPPGDTRPPPRVAVKILVGGEAL